MGLKDGSLSVVEDTVGTNSMFCEALVFVYLASTQPLMHNSMIWSSYIHVIGRVKYDFLDFWIFGVVCPLFHNGEMRPIPTLICRFMPRCAGMEILRYA